MHAANLGDRREGVVYPSWMSDPKRVLLRRINRLDFGKELTEGLPDGISVRRESTKAQGGKDVLAVYVDGVKALHESNLKEDAAERVAAWIEAYEKEENEVMALTGKALEILKTVAAAGVEGIAREKLIAQVKPGNSLTFMLKRHSALVGVDDTDHIFITEAGRTELRGLPEFDMPLDAGDAASVDQPEMGGTGDEIDAATIQRLREELPNFAANQMVRLLLGHGVTLEDLVTRGAAEVMSMGGIVIKLELALPLLVELHPPLKKMIEGLEAVGVEFAVFGDLTISIEQPMSCANDEIPFVLG